jgi:mannose-6-phosphate isomerase-like protein (cupin superfamily)
MTKPARRASDEDRATSMIERQAMRTRGWQVASIDENAPLDHSAFVALTQHDESAVILNCYQPGQHDEMHCHPKEEHVFLVWKGKLHLTGVEDGEDVTLGAGRFVHIDANYYYRLHNPGPEPAVYCQFRTVPAKAPKRRIVFFEESARGKREAAATREGHK